MIEYRFAATYDEWNSISNQLESQLRKDNVDSKNVRRIMMALEEILSNIIRYNKDTIYIYLVYQIVRKDSESNNISILKIVIRDNGVPFNPRTVEYASRDESVVRNRTGGMGITIARKLMDEIDYEYVNANILTITKLLGDFNDGE